MKLKFVTCGEKELISKYMLVKEPHIFISICNPGKKIELPKNIYRKDVLELHFEDIEDIKENSVYFNMGIAEDILDFVNKYIGNVTTIVVQCEAGVCRSVAVASALSKIINNVDDNIFLTGLPNMFVYTTLLDCYFSNKKIRERWQKIYYVRCNSLKEYVSPVIQRLSDYKISKREKEV